MANPPSSYHLPQAGQLIIAATGLPPEVPVPSEPEQSDRGAPALLSLESEDESEHPFGVGILELPFPILEPMDDLALRVALPPSPGAKSDFGMPEMLAALSEQKSDFNIQEMLSELPETKSDFNMQEMLSKLPEPKSDFNIQEMLSVLPEPKSDFSIQRMLRELPEPKSDFGIQSMLCELPEPKSDFGIQSMLCELPEPTSNLDMQATLTPAPVPEPQGPSGSRERRPWVWGEPAPSPTESELHTIAREGGQIPESDDADSPGSHLRMHGLFFRRIHEHISHFYNLEYALSGAFDELIAELEVNGE